MSTAIATVDIPKEPARRRGWVIWQLHMRGTSLNQLSKTLGISRQALSSCLLVPSQYAEQAIADALGLSVKQLFPERFDAAGQRITRVRPQQRSRPKRRRNVYVGSAA